MTTQTKLSAAAVTALTTAITGNPLGRLATLGKTIDRFDRALAEVATGSKFLEIRELVLSADDLDEARFRLDAALDCADADAAAEAVAADPSADTAPETPSEAVVSSASKAEADPKVRAVAKRLAAETVAKSVPAAETVAPTDGGSDADRPWFRTKEIVDRKVAAIYRKTPGKVGVARAAFGKADPEFAALKDTAQKGIVRQSVNRLVEAGKLSRDGSVFAAADAKV